MFGLFKNKNIDYQATVLTADNKAITVRKGDSLLKAGLEAGLAWPHDCRVGSCGTCRCRLVNGKIKALTDFGYVLDPDQLKSGTILACQTQLRSDIEVEVDLLQDAGFASVSSHNGVIKQTRKLAEDILEVTIQCDTNVEHRARAGQYAELATPGVKRVRSYSYAKAPENEKPGEFTFFIRHVHGGEHTDWLFEQDRSGLDVVVSGPYGSFYLRETSGPMLCVTGGSGLAPVKAILEDMVNRKIKRDVILLFGVQFQKNLYCLDEIKAIKESWHTQARFEFVPVLSREPQDSDWQGARGYVTNYLQNEFIDK